MSARHARLAAEAGSFRDPATGEPMLVAAKVHMRSLADLFYLSRVRIVGQPEAGRETCERYGHEATAQRCPRCGAAVR